MCVKQNTIENTRKFPLAAKAVEESFYINYGLTGADNVEMAITLQQELQSLLFSSGLLLQKWNSSNLTGLESINPEILDSGGTHHMSDKRESTKTLGLKWDTNLGEFYIAVNESTPSDHITKRILVSDLAKT